MRRLWAFVFCFSLLIPVKAQTSDFEFYASNAMPNQSAANYGKYLFLISDGLSRIMLYDLDKREPIYTLSLSGLDVVDNPSTSHCNQCCFGKEKFSKKDDFPLFYISQRAPRKSEGAYLDVFRIITYKSEKKKIDSLNIQRVQRIHFPQMTDSNCLGNPNATIDVKRGFLYIYSRNNNSKADNYLKSVISSIKLPSLYKEGEIVSDVWLSDLDILEQKKYDFSLLNAQGGFYRNGKLYFAQGYPSTNQELNYIFFRIIDVKGKKAPQSIDMHKDGFKYEPEGCWFWKGLVWISTDQGYIYKLIGKKYKVK